MFIRLFFENKFSNFLFIYLDKPLVVDLPRSSSTSSLDNIITNESICTIQFSETFTYKNGLYFKIKTILLIYLFLLIKILLFHQVFGLVQVPVLL